LRAEFEGYDWGVAGVASYQSQNGVKDRTNEGDLTKKTHVIENVGEELSEGDFR
jgi:hypothetical protein